MTRFMRIARGKPLSLKTPKRGSPARGHDKPRQGLFFMGYAVMPATLPAGQCFISVSTSKHTAARTNMTAAILSGWPEAQATAVA
jgi:hypothetical protein